MKRIAERTDAKLTILRHLHDSKLVKDKDVLAAAKTRLGAELVESMKGASLQELVEEKTQRL